MTVDGVVAEWEYESARVVEYSAVNVPAVLGTYVLDQLEGDDQVEALAELELLCGRRPPTALTAALHARMGGAPKGGFTRTVPAPTMATMDPREEMARALGLDPAATWEQIRAAVAHQGTQASQADVARAQLEETRAALAAARVQDTVRQAELDAAHIESALSRLSATRQVGDRVIASLRAAAAGPPGPNGPNGTPIATYNRAAFDSNLALVEQAAPEIVAAAGPTARPILQSDTRPAADPDPGAEDDLGPDAFERHKSNPVLSRLMRGCRVTAAQVREHGPRTLNIVTNLRDLVEASARRGA
jgi:hypothetical protein